MTKQLRASIKAKYDGKCMYCGQPLGERFHVDHIRPIFRGRARVPEGSGNFDENHGTDTVENMGPACIPCNLWKRTFSIEEFRKEVEAQPKRLLEKSGGFRLANRFELVNICDDPVVFWFEIVERSKK